MLNADEARHLASRTKAAMEALEATLTDDAQKAAAALLHRRLNRIAREVRERWTELFPADEIGTFSTGGDKPDDGDD